MSANRKAKVLTLLPWVPFSQVTDMKNIKTRALISVICTLSILSTFTGANAAPVRFDQVVQIINARPGKAETSLFSQLRVANDYSFLISAGDDDDKGKKNVQPHPDGQIR